MTTEEQYRSSEIYQTNGTEDIHGDDNDSETTLSSSGPAVRRSRFFRSKRKQRLHEDQVNSNGDESNEAGKLRSFSSRSIRHVLAGFCSFARVRCRGTFNK